MAFSVKQTKAKLQEFGVPAENLDTAAEYFCSAHKTDLDSVLEQRDAYKVDADKLPAVQAELDALKNQQDDGFKEKYEKVKAEFKDYKTAVENEKALAAKKVAYTEICKDAGLSEKGIEKAVKYADWDAVELDDDGKVKDAKTHIKNIKEEWAEHVIDPNEGKTVRVDFGATTGGGNAGKTIDEIMAIKDDAERQAAIAENHTLFGF